MHSSLEHASEDELEHYCLGLLPDAGAVRLEEHLLVCAECREWLDETEAYVWAMKRAAGRLRDQDKLALPGRFAALSGLVRGRRLAWGLAAVLALAAVLWLPAARTRPGLPAAPPLAVSLFAFRSDDSGAVAPAGRPLVLEAEWAGTELPPRLEAQIVTPAGREAGRQPAEVRQGRVTVPVAGGLSRGSYWVRLLDADRRGEILREYALRVE